MSYSGDESSWSLSSDESSWSLSTDESSWSLSRDESSWRLSSDESSITNVECRVRSLSHWSIFSANQILRHVFSLTYIRDVPCLFLYAGSKVKSLRP